MKKRKIKWKVIIALLLFLICLITLIISTINIIKWSIDSKKTNEQITTIQSETKVNEVVDTNNTEIMEQEYISAFNPYWDYIKMNMIDVNLNKLKIMNNEVKGWIQVKGTNINYPFVQTNNNNYYLNHSFDKSYNSAGWVYADYRNNLSINEKNTILYAHGRNDKTMFGSLKDILSNNWLQDTKNHVIKLSTEYENTLWQVFSVYRIPTTNDYLNINFSDDTFTQFINMLLNRSIYNFNTTVSPNDRILTLSTCYNESDKIVLHAKLIKREPK